MTRPEAAGVAFPRGWAYIPDGAGDGAGNEGWGDLTRRESGNPRAIPRAGAAKDPLRACAACEARGLAFCAALGDQELAELAAFRRLEEYGAGAEIFAHEDPAASVYNLTGGCVHLVTLLADGRRQVMAFVLAGEYFGAITGERYPYGAEAVTDIAVCRYPRARLGPFIDTHASLQRKLLDMAWTEVDRLQEHMLLLGRKTPMEKIASFLLAYSRRAHRLDQPATPVTLPMGRGDIADHLGLTIETVSRTFTKLRAEGWLSLPEPHIVRLENTDALTEAAEG